MDALLDLADNWLGLRRIEVVVFADDEPAASFYGQYGFEQEASLRRYAFRDGAYRDTRLLTRLRQPAQSAPADEETALEAPPAAPVRESKEGKLAITIRGIEIDDWEDVAALRESGNVIYYTLQIPYLSRDAVRDRLENMPKNQRGLAAVVKDRVVGHLGLHLESGRRAHSAGLGMMVHADYQGRGVGTALMAAAINLAENWLALSRIELTVFTDNAAGVALYRKFGFEIEGTLRDCAFRNGRYVDAYLMSRIRDKV
ncbi:MAG: GNAT family N-acetyltransferase [Chloroflexi bacterium]|nr:MAG: GNAT family N-acetyltransferase [Chloroflexota bacterium]